jgi:hypothetical protein
MMTIFREIHGSSRELADCPVQFQTTSLQRCRYFCTDVAEHNVARAFAT